MASNLRGAVEVETTHGGIELQGVDGAITARTFAGNIEISGLRGAALRAQHDISAALGSVSVVWPKNTPLTFRLESQHGSVSTALPARRQEEGARTLVEGGSGEARLVVATRSGDIDVQPR